MAEVSAAGFMAAALAGGVEAASAAGAAVTAGEGGVAATVAGAMPDGAIRGGGGYPYGYADDYGSGWGPDYAGYGYCYPPAYGGGRSCWVHRKVWTQPGGRGRYLGRRLVNVCQ